MSERKKANTLQLKQKFELMKLVQAKYTDSKLTDDGFAQLATGELGISVVKSNVQYARTQLDIPANHGPGTNPTGQELVALTIRVANLEARVETYIAETEILREYLKGKQK